MGIFFTLSKSPVLLVIDLLIAAASQSALSCDPGEPASGVMATSHVLSKFVKGKSPETFLYFAFGSNLSSERIRVQNPSAKFLTTARLKGYRLNFDSYSTRWRGSPATITQTDNPTDRVYGVLWELDLEHLQTLDDQEGVANEVYHRLTLPVAPCTVALGAVQHCQNEDNYEGIVEVLTYQLTPKRLALARGQGDSRPSLAYKSVILKGAREHKLPKSYLDELVAVQDNGDGDHVDLKSAVARNE